MTVATQTSLGDIALAGDLGGSTNALAPELSASGVTAGSYTFPTLTLDTKGRVTSASSGNASAVTALIPTASATVVGIASFSPTYFTVSGAGNVALNPSSLPAASSSTPGVVTTGTNISNSSGTISIPTATASTPGIVQAGANIVSTAGVLSVPTASSSVLGVGSFSSDFTVTSGAVTLNASIALLNTQNTWQKAQSYAISALTSAASITPDFSLSNVFTLTAGSNFTLTNPTNVVAGTTYLIIITQDATGGRTITFGANYLFGAGAVKTLSTVAGKRDIISIVALSSTQLLVTMQLGF